MLIMIFLLIKVMQDIAINNFESFEEFDEGIPGINNSRQVIKWLYDERF